MFFDDMGGVFLLSLLWLVLCGPTLRRRLASLLLRLLELFWVSSLPFLGASSTGAAFFFAISRGVVKELWG